MNEIVGLDKAEWMVLIPTALGAVAVMGVAVACYIMIRVSWQMQAGVTNLMGILRAHRDIVQHHAVRHADEMRDIAVAHLDGLYANHQRRPDRMEEAMRALRAKQPPAPTRQRGSAFTSTAT